MTKRRHISRRDRLKIFEAAEGRCHICEIKIKVGEAWQVEHPIAIALGGSDEIDEMRPAHVACHKVKTREDVGRICKADRQKARHLGISKTRKGKPLPGTKASGLRKRMDGTVERRDE